MFRSGRIAGDGRGQPAEGDPGPDGATGARGAEAIITGQSTVRTGLSKVGLPGAEAGMKPQDPTIARILKGMGYATGQFGKNHLGDRDEHLPKYSSKPCMVGRCSSRSPWWFLPN